MLYSRLYSNKPMPHFIQDFGIYAGSIELEPRENKTNNNSEKDDESIILDYLKTIKKIKDLEKTRLAMSKKIMNNPNLKEKLNQFLSDNICLKKK